MEIQDSERRVMDGKPYFRYQPKKVQSKTQRRAGRRPHLPHVVATTLLYGRVRGIERLGKGKLLVTIKDLADHLRCTGINLKERLQLLHKWGIIEELSISRYTATLTLTKPVGWDL